MVKRIFLITYVLITFSAADHAAQNINYQDNVGKLHIKITGFQSNRGNCRFALDNSKSVFESDDSVFIGKILPIVDNQVIITIDSLRYGEYAIKVFHDENSNGELDTNFLGIPTEDYGYSNNASSWFGPPSWENAKFTFNQKKMLIEILND